MDFLGIGIPEAIFFILIMLLVLGPSDMAKVGRSLGTNIRKIMTSPTWRMIFSTSNTLRNLPNALAREAGVEELRQELKRETESIKKMREEIVEATQLPLPKASPLPDYLKPVTPAPSSKTAPTSTPHKGELSAWTTPVKSAPLPAREETNSILPPSWTSPPPPTVAGPQADSLAVTPPPSEAPSQPD